LLLVLVSTEEAQNRRECSTCRNPDLQTGNTSTQEVKRGRKGIRGYNVKIAMITKWTTRRAWREGKKKRFSKTVSSNKRRKTKELKNLKRVGGD